MNTNNTRTSAADGSAQENVPAANEQTKPAVVVTPSRSIRPNGTAPIGSEVAELKKRQASIAPGTKSEEGEEEGASAKAFHAHCGISLKEYSAQKASKGGHTGSSDGSNDAGGVKLPKEETEIAPEDSGESEQSPESAITVVRTAVDAVAPPPTTSVGLASRAPLVAPAELALSRGLSVEGLISIQAQAAEAARTQTTLAFQRQLSEMGQQHQKELAERDGQLRDMAETIRVMSETLEKMDTAPKKKGKRPVKEVTPANQVAFQEPATNVYPAQQQLGHSTNAVAPAHRIIKPHLPALTYPGAHHPAQGAHYAAGPDSPEYITQPKPKVAGMGVNKDANAGQQIHVIPDPEDDVFGAVPSSIPPGVPFFPTTSGFEQRGLKESLTACFSKMEGALRMVPMVQMTSRPRGDFAVHQIVEMCQQHIENRREAYTMLEHEDEKYFIMTGVFTDLIKKNIFIDPIMTRFDCVYRAEMNHFWIQEAETAETDASNIPKRLWLGEQRAAAARRVVNVNGFWKWVQDYTTEVLDRMLVQIHVAFPATHITTLRAHLWRAVNEALRIGIRMREDPRTYLFYYPKVGTTWDNRFMVQRNPELVGQELSNVRTPYVTRCTGRPLVKRSNLTTDNGNPEVVHKGEVLVSERKKNLRPWRRPGYYGRSRR